MELFVSNGSHHITEPRICRFMACFPRLLPRMQRASTVGVAWALVALVASSSCDAFSVTNGPIAPLNPAADHRFLEQTYSVGQGLVGDLLNHESLQTLKLSIPGRVFVSYNYDLRSNPSEPSAWPLAAATIRFSGNSEDIFQYFEVVSTAPHVVEVRHRSNVRGYISDAYLLTEISVSQSHAISEIVTSGSADVIIEDQVLVSGGENALKLKLAGSGSVYIDSKSSSLLGKTSIESSGSGSVHWSTGSLQTESLELSLQGSGDFTLIGQSLVTTSIEVAIAGSGDVCVDATSIQTNSLTTATIGSGEISFSAASAHCNHEDISILGSGDVYVGAIQCNDAKVTLAGSGDVYVQAVQSIHGSAYGSGDVKYVGATPQRISDRYDSSRFSSENNKKYHPIAKPKATNTATTCRPGSIPPRAAIHVSVSVWKVDGSSILGPLVFFAIISLCYLRCQRKRPRRNRRRVPQFGAYPPQLASELQPLQAAPPQQPQSQVYI